MKQKFATQVEEEILAKTRAIAEREGRQLQSVIEEALSDLIEKRESTKPRPHFMAHVQASLTEFGTVYERLAK